MGKKGYISLRRYVQADSGTQPLPIQHIPGSFPELTRSGRETEHALPSGVEVKNAWTYNSPIRLHGVVLN
jgi:hypothetical protein